MMSFSEDGGRLIMGRASALPSHNNKYRAIPTEVDGIRFHSRREAERYKNLKILLRCKEISNLRLQVEYPIIVNGQKVCSYFADFVYWDEARQAEIVEDSKGMSTPVYRLKKKLLKATMGIEIVEV
jgi:hypothetical protein